MANEINQDGFGNNAFQGISNSNINVTQIIGISPDFINLQTQLHDMEQLLVLLPEEKEQERNELSARIYKHKELIEGFKSDVLKLAESFSRIEINTDRLKRAKAHFDKGEITEARVVLEDALEEMADEKRGLLAKRKEYEEDTIPKLQSKADEYLILAQTSALNYESPSRIGDTKKYFEDSIECSASFSNVFEYAMFLWQHSEFRRAIDFWQNAMEIARNNNDRQGEVRCPGNLGNAHHALGEYKKAREFHEQGLAIAREIGNRLVEGKCLGNLGLVYDSLGEHQKAIEFYEQSLKIVRELGNRSNEWACLDNLGLAYYSLGEHQKAIGYYEQALKIGLEIGDRLGEGQSLGYLGNAYYSLGEYQKSIEYQEQSLKIAREMGDRLVEGRSLRDLGNAYSSLGENEKACSYRQQSLAILEAIEVPQAEAVRERIQETGCNKGSE